MGELIPVFHEEMVPGDTFQIGNESIIRFQPMVAPILHEVTVYTHYFFVPYRILWEHWERFITGGSDGNDNTPIPLWPVNLVNNHPIGEHFRNIYSLWDYFGFPVHGYNAHGHGALPLAFPLRAYNLIFDEYYRDENLQSRTGTAAQFHEPPVSDEWTPSQLDGNTFGHWPDESHMPRLRNWTKDYFTSALPWQLRGVAPAMPLSGNVPVILEATLAGDPPAFGRWRVDANIPATQNPMELRPHGISSNRTGTGSLWAELGSGVTFDISDIRRAFQLQKWMERNARAGVRYIEFLRSHFGVSPRDERLNRPEYIGGSRSAVTVSEVLQTSESGGTPQANMAGHGIQAGGNYVGSYKAYEFGIVMGLMSVMPKPCYEDGINRQWLRRTRFEFYFPEFSHLSEQGITNAEIFARGNPGDNNIWGFQGAYDEMRVKNDMVCSEMRVNLNPRYPSLSFWHLGRSFSEVPNLNSAFVQCNPTTRPFAVHAVGIREARPLIVNFANLVKAIRPLPSIATPGLIDHF